MIRTAASCLGGLLIVACASVGERQPVRLYAAGSLRVAMTEIGAAYYKIAGVTVVNEFGASGLLRERIEQGAPAEVFTSADVGHPRRLEQAGRSGPIVLFTRNHLCALASPRVDVTTASLLDVLLDPKVRVGTSTPKNDPSGDYTWVMFEKAEKLRAGAYATLDRNALKLVGGAGGPPPPKGRSVYSMLMAEDRADVFITYCTNAVLAHREVPGLKVIQLPEALAVGADYGMTVMKGASAAAERYAQFILSEPAQKILAKHGFAAVR